MKKNWWVFVIIVIIISAISINYYNHKGESISVIEYQECIDNLIRDRIPIVEKIEEESPGITAFEVQNIFRELEADGVIEPLNYSGCRVFLGPYSGDTEK